ncbi:glycosyl hydrolases family 31-domain-containing protein [Dunaliella salina]|uniref:Glycosyl hydrolases family 31-domain-containing protein n=1 Tax=Dunaliella salina TaxID=3046 RepID=A0ABQ7GJC3_DUNSA|nr:glycosyl hydrolases family 31-domain-containing protein [Dunaliella salina]|eukprot:KAF5834709.1 glycosyl hydrolases family 31-domain-containing protein [Dunaliella salina]
MLSTRLSNTQVTFPKDNLHVGGVEHRSVHNRYGLDYHQATADGLYRRGYQTHGPDGDRPFVLSRAFFPGTQRVGPIWTGDNFAKWDHLQMSVPMLLTISMAGLPFSGADVAGFFGNPEPELMVRWNQLAVFYPFFRGHAHLESPRREPYLFAEPYASHLRNAIRSRYALLPYMYTLFRHANITGVPLLRPLWYEFPDNKDTFDLDTQLMLGPSMLISPVMTPGATSIDVLLPRASRWYDANTGAEVERSSSWLSSGGDKQKVQVTLDSIPVYYRGGSVVPRRERPRRAANMMLDDPVTLVVALDANNQASGDLYLDDGHSFAFKRGEYLHRSFTFNGGQLQSTPAPTATNTPPGSLQLPTVTVERIVFMGLPKKGAFQAKLPSGQVVDLEFEPISVVAPRAASAHVMRKPDLPISQDWTVEIYPKQ